VSDKEVHGYFTSLHNENDSSISAHLAIACFLGAAYRTMLKWLLEAQNNRTPEQLLDHWHLMMERSPGRSDRDKFFLEVVSLANSVNHRSFPLAYPKTQCLLDEKTHSVALRGDTQYNGLIV
jgi:hypothetical protein